jgi:hypothetical protein
MTFCFTFFRILSQATLVNTIVPLFDFVLLLMGFTQQ